MTLCVIKCFEQGECPSRSVKSLSSFLVTLQAYFVMGIAMKYQLSALLLAFASLSSAATLPKDFGAVDFDIALKKSASDGKPIMLFVSSEGCGPCMKARAMLATRKLSEAYIPAANFVNVESNIPPKWYRERTAKSGFGWTNLTSRGNLNRPNFVFLNVEGQYMCTLNGVFNNYTHALNIINGVKDLQLKPSLEYKDCPGAMV